MVGQKQSLLNTMKVFVHPAANSTKAIKTKTSDRPQSVSVLATIKSQSATYQSALICVDVVTNNCFEVLYT